MNKEAKQQVHGSYKTHTPIAGVIQSSILRLFEAILVHFGGILGLSKTPAADKRPLPKFYVEPVEQEACGPKSVQEP